MPGYFAYCRKSSEAEDRQVLSIESQNRELQELAAKLNLNVIQFFSEAKTAKEPGRPVFNVMMQRINRGEAHGIVCWKLDRLARNPVDGGSVIWAIKQRGIKVLTPAQTYAPEDDNVMLMYIEFGMAQKYVDDLSKNVKRGLRTKLQNGWYPGIPPPGYLSSRDPFTGKTTITKDPERFPLIRRMWELMLNGNHSPASILDIATNEWGLRTRPMRTRGGRPFAKSAIYKIFTHEFYCGTFEYPKRSGSRYKGRHEPMVSEAEFDRVQSLLGQRGSPRPRLMDRFPFTGVLTCGECGGAVTAEDKFQVVCGNCRLKFAYRHRNACPQCHQELQSMHNPKYVQYTYYHCTKRKNPRCSQRSITAQLVESHVLEFLSSIEIPKGFSDWCIKYLQEINARESAAIVEIRRVQRKALEDCERRIANLLKLKTSAQNIDGSLLSDDEYASARGDLLKERQQLEEAGNDSAQDPEICLERAKAVLNNAEMVRERFVEADGKTKKTILLTLCSNLTLIDGRLRIEAKKPFIILGDCLSVPRSQPSPFEPQKNRTVHGSSGGDNAQIPLVRAPRDEVRTVRDKAERTAALIYAHFNKEFNFPGLN